MIKTILITICSYIFSSSVFAFSNQLEISANIDAGCFISSSSADFGFISYSKMNNDSQTRTFQNLKINCSKGVTYTLSGDKNQKIPSLSGMSSGIPLWGEKENNKIYPLSITVYAYDCIHAVEPYNVWFSGGSSSSLNKDTFTKTSTGITEVIPICYGLKGYKSFPGFQPLSDIYSGIYNFYLLY